jgi:drug/metabolite transporter (DMT)-like permease
MGGRTMRRNSFTATRQVTVRAGLLARAWRRLAANVRGILAMLFANAVFVLGDAAMKLMAAAMPTGETMFIRGIIATVLIVAIAHATGAFSDFRAHLSPLLGWRTAAEVGAGLSFQNGLARLPFAEVSAILQVNPLVVTAGAALFLREKVGWRRWTATAVGLCGVLLIVRPGTAAFHWASLLLLLAVLFSMSRDLCTRSLPDGIPPLLVTAIAAPATMLGSLLLLPLESWRMPSVGDVAVLAIPAACMLVGQFCVIVSIRSGDVSAVAPFRYSSIIWALLLSVLIWREFPDRLTLLGVAIVVGAGLYTIYREQVLRRLARDRAASSGGAA